MDTHHGGRFSRLWSGRSRRTPSTTEVVDVDSDARIAAVEARVAHLEAAFEGLQDSVYRQALREEDQIDDLRRRTDPSHIAQELNRDARKRGL